LALLSLSLKFNCFDWLSLLSPASLQFNCTYRKNQDTLGGSGSSGSFPRIAPAAKEPLSTDVMVNMELYNTHLFHYPSTQAFHTVSKNKQVFVEVNEAVKYYKLY
jgi:hypothetical protein